MLPAVAEVEHEAELVARPDRISDQAFQWKRAFDAVVAGEHFAEDGLEVLALDYGTREEEGLGLTAELALDPVPADFELRYPPRRSPTPLEILASTAEALAYELSDALRASGVTEPVSA